LIDAHVHTLYIYTQHLLENSHQNQNTFQKVTKSGRESAKNLQP
jgi:hypothetical protein